VTLEGDECVTGFRCSPSCARIASRASLYLTLPQPSQQRPFASVTLEGNECDRVPIALASEAAVGSDDSRAVHASLREPRCTWRCRNRARALASVTLEGDECVRVPIIASYVCVRAPIAELRVHRHDELDKLGVAQASHRPCGLMEMSVSGFRSPSFVRIATSSQASLALSHQHSRRRCAMHVHIEDVASCAHCPTPRCIQHDPTAALSGQLHRSKVCAAVA
jgi:hypothetical protein